MDFKLDKVLTIYFAGSVNSNSVSEVENEVLAIINEQRKNNEPIVLDFSGLLYISSAGLRAVLKLKKLYSEVKIIEASEDVYAVFEMTGFTSIIDISKKLREISIANLEKIAEGAIGKIYRFDEERIVKVFSSLTTLEEIENERKMAKTAFVLGVPTALSFEIVKIKEGGYGSIFEMIKSDCFNKLFIRNPENYEIYSKQYTDLLRTIITTNVAPGKLPNKKVAALTWMAGLKEHHCFDDEVINKLIRMINDLPDTNTMIHGDYHIKNIMIEDGDPTLIDMETLGVGHPIFEFSAFYLTYLGYPSTEPGNSEAFLGISDETAIRLFNDCLNAIYGDRSEEEKRIIVDKIALFGYAWLAYKCYIFEPDNKTRLEHAREMVLSLIDKYDSFVF